MKAVLQYMFILWCCIFFGAFVNLMLNYTVFQKKFTPYEFDLFDNSVKLKPIYIIFGIHVAYEICNNTVCQIYSLSIATLSFFLNTIMEH